MMYGLGTNAAGAKPAGNTPVSKNKGPNCNPTTHLIQLALKVRDEGKEREERIGYRVENNFTKIIYPQYNKP